MTINDVLFFDTETTGIPDRSAKWDTDFADYPHVVQIAWIHGCKVENHIIRPTGESPGNRKFGKNNGICRRTVGCK